VQLSAYIPCCNNARHIGAAIQSLQAQTLPIDDITVIDDGSVDGSAAVAEQHGVRVIRHERTLGRGAVNARGVAEARHDLILIVGATNVVPPDFARRAASWFEDGRVAAVCARIVPPPPSSLTDRWRARHLFLVNHHAEFRRGHHFGSTGSMLRRSHALAVGNFDARLTHTEDGELGDRLKAAGYDVLFDPELHVIPRWSNSLWKVLERHWRWYAGIDERISWLGYLKGVAYAMKVMVPADLRERDWAAAVISTLCPHHHFWLTAWRRVSRS
jgi:glycosyltransferase involved in cell wall biosynthesis